MRHKFEFNQCDGPVAPRNALVGAGKVNLYSANRIERIGRLEVFYFFSILLPGSFTCVRANVRERFGGPERGGSRYFDGVSIKDALAGAATIGTLARAECWPT